MQLGLKRKSKSQIGTRNPWSFNWDHNWSQDLMNLGFLMAHHRKNSVREKVIDKKWIYSERNTLHRQSGGQLRRLEWPQNMVKLIFMGWVISQANQWEDYSNYFGVKAKISENWATAFFLACDGWLCNWASLVAQMVKNLPQCGRPGFSLWVGKIPWRRKWQPTPVFLPGEPPWAEQPGGLQSTESQKVGHNRATKHAHIWNCDGACECAPELMLMKTYDEAPGPLEVKHCATLGLDGSNQFTLCPWAVIFFF